MKGRWKQAGEKAAHLLELPASSVTNGTILECNSNCEAIAEGCTGILEYTPREIRIATKEGTLRFCGGGLTIGAMDSGCLTVCGEIRSIEFLP